MNLIRERLIVDENWQENVLRLLIYAVLGGTVMLLLSFLLIPFDAPFIISGLVIALLTAVITLILLRKANRAIAVWGLIAGTAIGVILMAIQGGDPNHIVVILTSVIGVIVVFVVGLPVQVFATGSLSVATNIVVTALLIRGYFDPSPIFSEAESTATINILISILIPLTVISWFFEHLIQELRENNSLLRKEIELRKVVEERLFTEQEKYKQQFTWFRDVINDSPDIFMVYDDKGILVDVNETGVEELGYSREELIGLSIADIDADWDPERMQAEQENQKQTGHDAILMGRNRRKDGSIFPVEVASSILYEGDKLRRVGFVRNITSRVQAENELRESEEKFRSIFNSTPIGMYLVDKEGEMIEVNDRWLALTGFTREEMLGQKSVDFLTPESKKQAVEIDFPLFHQRGYAKDMPYQVVRKNGEIFDILLHGTKRLDANGDYDGVLASIIDVTERNKLQLAFEQNERRFKALYNDSPIMMHTVDAAGNLAEANDYWCKEMGYSRDEIVGKPISQFFTEQSMIQAMESDIPTYLSTGYAENLTYQMIKKNGEIIDVQVSIAVQYDDSGNFSAAQATIKNITELKKAEAQLQQSEKKFKALFDDSSDYSFALAPDGCVLDINDRVESATSNGREIFIGNRLWEAEPFERMREAGEVLHEMYTESLANKTGARREVFIETEDLGNLYLDIILKPLYDHDQSLEMIIVEARDITQLVETREALRHTADDNQVLLKEVHHRVKNNLQIIISMLRTQIRATPSAPLQASYLEIMSRVQSMSLIHQQLYQRNSNLGEIELDTYIRQLLKEVNRSYNVPIDLDIDIAPIQLDVDRSLTCGLIINELATNALKYAFDGLGGKLEVSGRQANGVIHLHVKDNGKGLPEDFKLEDATSTGFQLIKLMCQQIGADISISGDTGRGTHAKLRFAV